MPEKKVVLKASPILFMKSMKNPTEFQGMVNAHIRDAVALVSFMAEIDDDVSIYLVVGTTHYHYPLLGSTH